ncbi:MAG: FAD-dependent oxidoreductase [Streptosporangiales bacterium]|nr:FAD-dependent oxidoreductase [Streptosporangiales bacterium]
MARVGSRMTADVVVVGAGAFGLATAATLAAAAPAAKILVYERDVTTPTNAELGSGSVIAAGTRLQRQAGVDDDPDAMADDILAKSHGTDERLVRRLCAESPHAVDWLLDEVGVPLELATEARRVGHGRIRLHATRERSGAPLIGALRTHTVGRPGVRIVDHTAVADLVYEGGRVAGIRTGAVDGGLEMRASATVLACGGFAADRATMERYLPTVASARYLGGRGHRGDAVRWAAEVSADLVDMGGYLGQGYAIACATDPRHHAARLNPGIVTAGAVIVDRTGHRVVREDQGYSEWAGVMFERFGGLGIAVWDDRIQRAYGDTGAMRDVTAVDGVHTAATVAELATLVDVPAQALTATVDAYNAGIARGVDPLGREIGGEPLRAPFYAAAITGGVLQSLGGMRVDVCGRVLGVDGAPITDLYAGGAAAAGLSGGSPDGYLSGSGLLTSLVFGRMVGRHLASL